MLTQTQRFLQGETVDGKFEIGEYLGGSNHSAVFRTQYGDIRPKDAAIKLVPAPAGAAEAQLSRWRLAANFSHPHLVQILQMGRCEAGNAAMLYVLTELASENLAEIIPERPLTTEEARELLEHVVDALGFIHRRGFVHGHIKPANIMAVGEELKLSSDGICRLGEDIEAAGPVRSARRHHQRSVSCGGHVVARRDARPSSDAAASHVESVGSKRSDITRGPAGTFPGYRPALPAPGSEESLERRDRCRAPAAVDATAPRRSAASRCSEGASYDSASGSAAWRSRRARSATLCGRSSGASCRAGGDFRGIENHRAPSCRPSDGGNIGEC